MPAHVRSILTQNDLNLPVSGGQCALGTWQGVYLWEHRHAPHRRKVLLTISRRLSSATARPAGIFMPAVSRNMIALRINSSCFAILQIGANRRPGFAGPG